MVFKSVCQKKREKYGTGVSMSILGTKDEKV